MSEFKRKLRAVFDRGHIIGAPHQPNAFRYVPRSTGSTGWNVYDKLENRFLTEQDVKSATFDSLKNEQILS